MHDRGLKGAALGVAAFSVLGMLVGSFAGGGPNPQMFAVAVAVLYFGVVAYLYSNGAKSLGGRSRMFCIIAASVAAGVMSAAVTWFLELDKYAPPIAIGLAGISGWCAAVAGAAKPEMEAPKGEADAKGLE